ncbi:MAG: hypothetical protein K2X03_08555 [Bryobacteraceae bacterium]|nr:hypothetical protein [Bryobacteraceae bacterium]
MLTLLLMLNFAQAGDIRLIILDPGHFHAALIQRDMYPGISPKVAVYAPLGPDVLDYLNRISRYNAQNTSWQLDVHTSPDFFTRMLEERAGNAVLFTGRNRPKINRIIQTLDAGYHVLVDKPWILRSTHLDELTLALDRAKERKLAAYDIMTERYEITSILQREFVNAPGVFGQQVPGTAQSPGIRARSIHQLMKTVSGVPLRRPVWFFDIDEYGEALADVGTHVVDLVQWTAFPTVQLDYQRDIEILGGRRWPTVMSAAQFEQVTGAKEYPAELSKWVKDGQLSYFGNNSVQYTVRGTHVDLEILWNWEGKSDLYEAVFRGSLAEVEIRQPDVTPELYVRPASASEAWRKQMRDKVSALAKTYPGLTWDAATGHVRIPESYRVGHEAHFAQVASKFFGYVRNPASMEAWERANMLAKYYITTRGVEISQPE